MKRGPEGFHYVTATREEVEDWRRRYPRRSASQYRVECDACGKRLWGSGLGIGAHRRACRGVREDDAGECEILVEIEGVASGERIGVCEADGRPVFRSRMGGTIYHTSEDR